MRSVRLRPAARRDLAEIWLYTADNYGVDQAERYAEAIGLEIARLVDFPERHERLASRNGDFRKAASGAHFVFYLVTDALIEVVRILHSSMDFDERLG